MRPINSEEYSQIQSIVFCLFRAVNPRSFIPAVQDSSAEFKTLIDNTPPEILGLALTLPNRMMVLSVAACYLSREVFMELVNKVSDTALVQALTMESCNGWTALHMAACYQPPVAFMVLINKVSGTEAFSQALQVNNDWGWTPLHMAVQYQTGVVVLAMIADVSTEILDKAFSLSEPHCLLDFSSHTTDKRYQFRQAITTVLNQIEESDVSNITLLEKLRVCVGLRRGRSRNRLFGYYFNRELGEMIERIENMLPRTSTLMGEDVEMQDQKSPGL